MRKFLVAKDSKEKDRADGAKREVPCKKDGSVIGSHEAMIQIPSKRSHPAIVSKERKKVFPPENKPQNKFQIPLRNEEKKHDNNLTKIQKLSYLMKTEYFTVHNNPSTTDEKTEDTREGEENQEEEPSAGIEEKINENERGDDEKECREAIVLEDDENIAEDPEEGDGEGHSEKRPRGSMIQSSMDEYFDLDPIKLEEKLLHHPLTRHIAQPQASPYFSRTPFQFYQNPAQYSKPLQLYRSNVSSVLIKKFANPSVATIRSSAYNSHRNGGVTCLEFDPLGVLIAVGSRNGVLRIFDCDEILFWIQKNSNYSRQRSQSSSPLSSLLPPLPSHLSQYPPNPTCLHPYHHKEHLFSRLDSFPAL
jgi:hypothetical protein